jgi:hypothetical protein
MPTPAPVKPAKSAKGKKNEVAPQAPKEIQYPELEAYLCTGDEAITVEKAKELLGWQEVESGPYLFVDREGKKILCTNNSKNRPFSMTNCESLVQEILMRRWRFNHEPIILGKYGQVLNGQHQLVGLCLAEQDRVGSQKHYWAEKWDGPVVLEKLIGVGLEETDDVVNTMDTAKPRSLSDVIFRSEYFAHLSNEKRSEASRMLDHAIRFLWQRTGAKNDPFAGIRTHSESLDFIARHPRLLKAVSHIQKENKDKSLRKHIGLGYCSAMMYLMGCGKSDEIDYRDSEGTASEAKLDWSYWTKAQQFWTEFSRASQKPAEDLPFKPLCYVLAHLHDADTGARVSRHEVIACVAKAWHLFKDGEALTITDVRPEYRTDQEGVGHLVNVPDFGGIDIPVKGEEEPDPTPEEVTEGKKQARTRKAADKGEEQPPEDETPEQERARRKRIEDQKAKLLEDRAKRKGDTNPAPTLTPKEIKAKKAAEKKALEAEIKAKAKLNGGKPKSRKDIQAENTEKARQADAEARQAIEEDEDQEPEWFEEEFEDAFDNAGDEDEE